MKIIAEIGINHMGNMNIARKLISDAAEVGADIAKFQWYSCDDLFGDPDKDTYNHEIYKLVKPFELDEKKIEQLIRWCQEDGIEFGCSVFDRDRFNKLEQFGVGFHKIASRVAKYDRSLAKDILNTGKSCYVSLGFGAEPFSEKYKNCKHLYCVAKYPTEYKDIQMPEVFGEGRKFYGFSSHAMTVYPSIVALSRGAQVVEVHFTMDKSMSALPGGFDHICSLDKKELSQLVVFRNHVNKLMAV